MRPGRSILVFLLTSLSAFSPSLCADNSHKYALIIGIGDYPESSGLQKLKADDDTDKLSANLKERGWNVYLMNRHADAAQQPNRANIFRALGVEEKGNESYNYVKSTAVSFLGADTLTADDTLMFYYGGHGTLLTNGQYYIIPKDVQDTHSRTDLIGLSVIQEALDLTKAGNVIVLTDDCRTRIDRGATAVAATGRAYEIRFPQRHYYTMSAARRGSPSYEKDDAGLFTYFLNAAFANPARAKANAGPCVTLREWGQFTLEQTQIYARTTLNTTQEPTLESDGSGWEDKFCMIPFEGATTDETKVTQPLPPSKPTIDVFEADKDTIEAGQSVTLTWAVRDAIRVVINNGVGSVAQSGSKRVQPTTDSTYMIVATGNGASTKATVDITVEEAEKQESSPCQILGTNIPWNPVGRASVAVDGQVVGTFDFGPGGSSALEFECSAGPHSFHIETLDAYGGRGFCNGGFSVSESSKQFVPAIRVNGYGMQCALNRVR